MSNTENNNIEETSNSSADKESLTNKAKERLNARKAKNSKSKNRKAANQQEDSSQTTETHLTSQYDELAEKYSIDKPEISNTPVAPKEKDLKQDTVVEPPKPTEASGDVEIPTANIDYVAEEVLEPEFYDSPEDFENSVKQDINTAIEYESKSYGADTGKYSHKQAKKVYRMRNKKRNAIILASCLAVLAVFIGVGTLFANTLLNTSFEDEDSLEIHEQLKATTNFEDPFYMVLVGTDTREEDGSFSLADGRSDSCMLVRIDPKEYVVTILSIPRDTKITYNGKTAKFNEAYSTGGIADTIKEVNKLCGVEVSHYAEVSFNGLTALIDAVGGVEVDVPEAINDEKSGVPVAAGTQTLNGEQALSFSRSRNFADGDFTRTADQRVLLKAVIQKAMKLPITEIPSVISAAKKFVKTDFSIMEIYSLASQFKDAENITVYSSMVPSTTGSIDGVSYCFTDKEALSRMMKMIENNEDPSMIEITSGASIGSSRDAQELEAQREEYYKQHPNSPGRATSSSSTSVNPYDDYSSSSSSSSYYNSSSNSSYY